MRRQILKQPSRQATYPLPLRRLGEVEPIVALETNDGANEPLVDESPRLHDDRIEELVVIDTQPDAVGLGRRDHCVRLFDREGHRFFDQYVAARPHCRHGEMRMRLRRRQDVHDIGFLQLQQLYKGSVHLLDSESPRECFGLCHVSVTQSDDAVSGLLDDETKVCACNIATTHNRNLHELSPVHTSVL